MITNENFIEEIKKKNTDAIEYVIDEYGSFLYKILYRELKKNELVEECLNDLFFKVWTNIDKFDVTRGSFKNWVARIGINLAIDMLRKNKDINYIDIKEIEEKISNNLVDVDNNELKILELKAVKENIDKLSRIDREIFVSRFFIGKSLKEISLELDMTVNNLRVRIYRGRETLKKLRKKE